MRSNCKNAYDRVSGFFSLGQNGGTESGTVCKGKSISVLPNALSSTAKYPNSEMQEIGVHFPFRYHQQDSRRRTREKYTNGKYGD